MPTLETSRLALRRLEPGDFDAVHSYASDPDTVKYMTWGPNTPEQTRAFLEQCAQESGRDPRRRYDFGITLRDDGKLIGACGIYLDEELQQGTVGWTLHRDHRSRGYCTEAARELLRFGFETLKLHRVYATCFTPNKASWRVMEKLGMRREGRHLSCQRMRCEKSLKWSDVFQYAILESEYYA